MFGAAAVETVRLFFFEEGGAGRLECGRGEDTFGAEEACAYN